MTAHCPDCKHPLLPEGTCTRCVRTRDEAFMRLTSLFAAPEVFILDTETTGLKGAEVIEIAVVSMRGQVVLNTLIDPLVRSMNPYAQRIHGLSLEDLVGAPRWPAVYKRLTQSVGDAPILAWNASFDERMIAQTSAAWGLFSAPLNFHCAMHLYARTFDRRTFALQDAIETEGVGQLFQSHRALGDVQRTLAVLEHRLKQVS